MPFQRIPLVGSFDQRNVDAITALDAGKDQSFSGCYFTFVDNPATRSRRTYVNKRPGLKADITPASGSKGRDALFGEWSSSGTEYNFSLFVSGSTETVYNGTTSVYQTTGTISGISEVMFAGTKYVFFTESGGVLGFITQAATGSLTFTADTTNGSAVLTNVSSTTTLLVGQTLSGTGIHAAARVSSIDSASQVTMTQNASATGSGVTITRGYMGRVLDSNLPSTITGNVVEMDGFLFIGTSGSSSLGTNGRIYNSDVNSITSWSATGYVTASIHAGDVVTIKKIKNRIACLGENGIDFFYNAGHATGSPLGRDESASIPIGVASSFRTPVASIGDRVFFKSRSYTNDPHIYELSASGIRKLSTAEISSFMLLTSKSASSTLFNISAFSLSGKVFVHISGGINGGAQVYSFLGDVDSTDGPAIWTASAFSNMPVFRMRTTDETTLNSGAYAIEQVSTTGKVYILTERLTAPVYQDDSAAYSMVITTTKLDLGTNVRKTVSRVDLVGSDIQSSGTATLETCDDDYTTWVTRGTFDLTDINPRVLRCGSHKGGRAYRITHSANTAFRASAIDVHYEVEDQGT